MTSLDLPAIRALHAGITPGPWEAVNSPELAPENDPDILATERAEMGGEAGSSVWVGGDALYGSLWPNRNARANAAFIAAAPSIVAQLLARIDAVTELHRPARRNHTSYNSDGTLIAYTVTEDGPCVACYPDYITQHCEECEDYDDTCGGVTGPVIQPWPCPTIKAITGKASDDGS